MKWTGCLKAMAVYRGFGLVWARLESGDGLEQCVEWLLEGLILLSVDSTKSLCPDSYLLFENKSLKIRYFSNILRLKSLP